MSDEQKILMEQWRKVFPIYNKTSVQSPSKLLIDKTLIGLEKSGVIELEILHYKGEEIIYSTIDEALEIFLNFHMESYFNEHELLPIIIEELEDYFKKFMDEEGAIRIKPGCFIYKVIKK
jgi:hypothetical protein